MGTLAHIYRHPIKGIGSEMLTEASLAVGAPLPGDRAWAVLQETAEDTDAWQPRRNFLVVAYGPKLAQITASTGGDARITLTHPDCAPLTFDPEQEMEALLAWVNPLWPETHPSPRRLVRAPAQGMADNGLPQLSIGGLSSLRALSERAGQPLDPRRFRANLWLEGLGPWGEFDLLGKTIRIGEAELLVTERIERCRATEANPVSGQRDVDTPRALIEGYGHKDFGVYATVTRAGRIAASDPVDVIA
ncbi:MAG: MOSC domain-containing protein [Pseudomonadota bacterium]